MTIPIRGFMAAIAALVLPNAAQAAERTVTLVAYNPACVSCSWIIDHTLAGLPGVSQVTITEDDQYSQAVVTVTFDDARVTPAALTTAVTNAGYPATVVADTAPAR